MKLDLRYFQTDCVEIAKTATNGIFNLCCGAGKTVIMANIERRGKTLLLVHRIELANQAEKYFDCSVSYYTAKDKDLSGDVVIASTQTITRQLGNIDPHLFHSVYVDECHGYMAKTFKRVIEHFKPKKLFGFTATPNRADGKGLGELFEDILYVYPIEQAIKEGYLSPITCKRVELDYDLDSIKKTAGDFNLAELGDAMEGTEHGIAEAYKKHARNKTLIFGVNIDHCRRISEQIPNSKYLHGGSKDRESVLKEFEHGDLDCLINCMLFTEGTDIPCIETIIWARPTQSNTLYIQGVCRGARLFPGKESMLLIDCVSASSNCSLCTAPTLIGLDIDDVINKSKIQGDLFEIPDFIEEELDTPGQWIKNVKTFDLWARKRRHKTHGVNYFKYADGRMNVSLPNRKWIEISTPDSLSRCYITASGGYKSDIMHVQQAFDKVYKTLNEKSNAVPIWNIKVAKRTWGKHKASPKQMYAIRSKFPDMIPLTKLEAAQIIGRLK